jgi:hypothetical protein
MLYYVYSAVSLALGVLSYALGASDRSLPVGARAPLEPAE